MTALKIKRDEIRKQAARRGIFSLAGLAREVGCSRAALYLCLERPSRYSGVARKLKEVLQ